MQPGKIEYFVSKKMGRAIFDYKMLAPRDRVLIGVSGGKDSITLLRLLSKWREVAPFAFHIMAIHVDMGPSAEGWGPAPGETRKIMDYLEKHGFEYLVEPAKPAGDKVTKRGVCFWCAWRRRKALFEAAGRLGYNKIALAHHRDDIVETILLNLFFQGELSSMVPNQELFEGALRIIRPFAYVEERLLKKIASLNDYPDLRICPYGDSSKRALMKKLLRDMEKQYRGVKSNVFNSLRRIRKDYLP